MLLSILLTETTDTQTSSGLFSGAGGTWGMIIWLVVIFVVMYFLMIRPQKKEQKKKEMLMNEMAVGDTVLTTSGFYGTIIDLQEDMVIVEFGNNKNCRIPMNKSAISQVEKPEDATKEAPAVEEKKGLFGKKKKDADAK